MKLSISNGQLGQGVLTAGDECLRLLDALMNRRDIVNYPAHLLLYYYL